MENAVEIERKKKKGNKRKKNKNKNTETMKWNHRNTKAAASYNTGLHLKDFPFLTPFRNLRSGQRGETHEDEHCSTVLQIEGSFKKALLIS